MKAHNVIKSILALSMAVASVTSCQDKLKTGISKGDAVKFSAGADASGTKAAYSGDGTTTIERIDWQEGDLIRIYCGQVSEPSDKFADYRVTADITPSGSSSMAHIEGTGGVGLRWGTGDHTFYATYPSPASSGITAGISANAVSASLPAEQAIIGDIQEFDGNYVAAPALKNMLMTAKVSYSPETGVPDGSVFLNFTPLTTAIKFTIENDTGAELALTDVQLISGNGKTSEEPVISGAFSVDLDQTDITAGDEVHPFSGNAFKITYSRDYPRCTSEAPTSTDMADRTLTISVGTDDNPLRLAVGKKLTFTFFLNPCHHFDDLTFKLVKAGGSWMSTWLGYTDGDGVFFPRHKKSTVEGLLVPEGAQWRISFDADITPWDAENGESGDLSLDPESKMAPIVTPWDEGISDNIEMVDPNPYQILTVTGDVLTDYQGVGTKSYSVMSDSPWKLQYSNDGGSSWTDAVANTAIDGWISFDKVSAFGSADARTVTATVTAATGTTSTVDHDSILRGATPKGTEAAPYDLSMHTIYGEARTSGQPVTANCYVVNAPGWYAFPLVYGNAIDYSKAGLTDGINTESYDPAGTSSNTFLKPFQGANSDITSPFITGASSAYPLWEDVGGYALISNTSADCKLVSSEDASSMGLTLGGRCGYVVFHVNQETLTQGNAVIAVSDGTDILWSWHIWVTDDDLTCVTVKNKETNPTFNRGIFPVNLGWVDLGTEKTEYEGKSLQIRFVQMKGSAVKNEAGKTAVRQEYGIVSVHNGQCPTYQWGRKDPFIRAADMGGLDGDKDLSADQRSGTFIDVENLSTALSSSGSIKSPTQFVGKSWFDTSSGGGGRFNNLWSAKNTAILANAVGYDEAPVKTVYDPCPPGFQVPQADAFLCFSKTNVEGGFSNGYNFYTQPEKSGAAVFFPAAGYRDTDGSLYYVGTSGYYWSAVPYNNNGHGYYLYFALNYVNPVDATPRCIGLSVRPVEE